MPTLAPEWLKFFITIGAVVLCIIAFRFVVAPLVRRATRRTQSTLDDALVGVLALPLYLGLILGGIYLALDQLSALQPAMKWISRATVVAATVLGFWTFLRVFNLLMLRAARATEEREDRDVQLYMNVIRKIVNVTVLALLVTLVLAQLGYKITTLLAGLGIAGLAVALALQDTLGNLFAGFYMLLDQPLKRGDYVKLETGEEGFVEEIGWRHTKIRPWDNNVIIIPNNKLAQSILVNYYLPEQRQRVYVYCGVSYDSDLEHVERVCKQVALEVMRRVEGSDPQWEPLVWFQEFGDSNINFVVILLIKRFGAQYVLTHEFIKALHQRFKEEGIEISWPVRKVVPAGRFDLLCSQPLPPATTDL